MGRIRVTGLAVGSRPMVDGRPADTEDQVRQMVAAFVPDTVPILSHHRGVILGYVDRLTAHGRDIEFSGEIGDRNRDLADVLRNGGIPISIEIAEGGEPIPGVSNRDGGFVATHPHYRGQVRDGWNVVGVALSDDPAAIGSVMWSSWSPW